MIMVTVPVMSIPSTFLTHLLCVVLRFIETITTSIRILINNFYTGLRCKSCCIKTFYTKTIFNSERLKCVSSGQI